LPYLEMPGAKDEDGGIGQIAPRYP
jgi:hypothetical protein